MTFLFDIIALLIVVLALAFALRRFLPARLAQRLGLKSASCTAKKSGCAGCKGGCR